MFSDLGKRPVLIEIEDQHFTLASTQQVTVIIQPKADIGVQGLAKMLFMLMHGDSIDREGLAVK